MSWGRVVLVAFMLVDTMLGLLVSHVEDRDYLLSKVSKVFPQLRREVLTEEDR